MQPRHEAPPLEPSGVKTLCPLAHCLIGERLGGSLASGAEAGSKTRARLKALAMVDLPGSAISVARAPLRGLLAGDPEPARGTLERPVDRRLDDADALEALAHALRALPGLDPNAMHLGLDLAEAAGRTPPQGPLRKLFGQFIGQDMPVEDSTHWPHIWQSKRRPFVTFSTKATGRSMRS